MAHYVWQLLMFSAVNVHSSAKSTTTMTGGNCTPLEANIDSMDWQ